MRFYFDKNAVSMFCRLEVILIGLGNVVTKPGNSLLLNLLCKTGTTAGIDPFLHSIQESFIIGSIRSAKSLSLCVVDS